jgi:hypothetical protein
LCLGNALFTGIKPGAAKALKVLSAAMQHARCQSLIDGCVVLVLTG